VSRAIREHNRTNPEDGIHEVIVHTGQHYDENISQVFFDELDIPQPDYNLEIGGGAHGAMTGRMLERIEHVLSGYGQRKEHDHVGSVIKTERICAGDLSSG